MNLIMIVLDFLVGATSLAVNVKKLKEKKRIKKDDVPTSPKKNSTKKRKRK